MSSYCVGSSDEDSMSAASTIPNSPDSTCRVVIVEQPMEKVRFRYLSELQGMPHGPLLGERSTKSNKSFPRVKLEGYDGVESVKIRCWLVDKAPRSLGGVIRPHCHDLVVRKNVSKNEIVHEPHEIAVSRDNNYTAVFENMVVLHCVQKNSESTYYNKELKWKDRLPGVSSSDSNKFDKKKIRDTIKCINKNEVYLYFEAFVETRDSEDILCWMLSNPVKNLKNPMSGDLKIIKVVNSCGPTDGNTEIALFTEKVPPDVKVKFTDDSTHWKEVVLPETTHRYLAITIRSPKYPYIISSSVKVKFCLYRESDGCESNTMEFTYLPSESPVLGKRKRMEISSEEQLNANNPVVNNTLMPFNDNLDDVAVVIDDILNPSVNDINALFEEKWSGTSLLNHLGSGDSDIIIEIDARCMESDGVTDSHVIGQTQQNGIRSPPWIQTKIEKLIKDIQLTSKYHNNCLQKAVIAGNTEETIKILYILKKYADVNRQTNLLDEILNIRYNNAQTLLHIAVQCNNASIVEALLKFGYDPLLQDKHGNNCFHLAASKPTKPVLQSLISRSVRVGRSADSSLSNDDGKTSLDPSILSETNSTGLNVLHIAVRAESIENVEYLLQTKLLNINSKDINSGDTSLHIACRLEHFEIARLLIKNGADVKDVNLSGFTPLHVSVARNDHRMADLLMKGKSDPKQECISLTLEKKSEVEYPEMDYGKSDLQEDYASSQQHDTNNAFALANDIMMYNILCGKMSSLDLNRMDSVKIDPKISENGLFTNDQFDRLCHILRENDNWKSVAEEFNLLRLLTPSFNEPVKVLLNYIQFQKNEILGRDDPRRVLVERFRSIKLTEAAEVLEGC